MPFRNLLKYPGEASDNSSWEAKASAKRAATLAKIPAGWRLDEQDLDRAANERDLTRSFINQHLLPEEIAIVEQGSVSLVEGIREGRLSAVQVTRAFCKTAAVAHQINNCLHEIFFDQALQRAQELDNHLASHGTVLGPLHGLPISLKDQFHVKGNATSMGYIGWIDTYEGNPDPNLVFNVNSQVVTELLALGAVLYCKTSLPQTLMLGETVNNIIGRTLNPVNQNLSCGGSSGGEGALSALHGSSVGLGTDIGGSVRIPAAFCGIFSLKPTHNRLSYRDVANAIPGQTTYASSVGVLGNTIEAIHLVLSSLISTKPWLRDPNVAPLPWRQGIVDETLSRAGKTSRSASAGEKRPLKLGILWTDGVVTPHPPVARGLHLVVEAVERAGHKVVTWTPPSQTTAKRVHISFLTADGGHDIHRQLDLSGEPLIPQLRDPFCLRDPMSLLEYQALTIEGRDYEAAYSDYWNETSNAEDAYTEAINLLDYSTVVIPVTKADKNQDLADENYVPLDELDVKNWRAYDPEIYDGAPVGVQIVARKYEEEKAWAIGKIVYDCLRELEV
ncbi:amidase signature domain-containing protein [Aspergillus avenaceus]|uniref:Amidase signature domain-containing protein n=1 Tax=Aspergillus avenaceus TaxID=36643 RepID=A0A5N6U7C0_ASPAV|nr:amidase signature domain-containing protein [Aspergillus avenaceus]